MQKCRICATFLIWHGPCKHYRICGMTRSPDFKRGMTMLNISNFGSRFAAAASAFALSLVMISATVSVPSTAQASAAYVSVVA